MCGGTGSLPLGWFMVRPFAGPFHRLCPGRGDAGLIGRPAPYYPTVKSILFSTVPDASLTSTCQAPVHSAPRTPRRSAHVQLDVAHLRVAVEPHVVDRRLAPCRRAAQLGPTDDLAHVRGECRARVLGCSIHHRLRHHGLADLEGRRGGRLGLGGVLCREGRRGGERQGSEDRAKVFHDGPPPEFARCTTRRRRCSSQAPSAAATTVPLAVPAVWNLIWYSSRRP